MAHVLNTHTETLHKPCNEDGMGVAACGSLRDVPPTRTRLVSVEELDGDVARCGNCFDVTGGY
ncbi:hypothetical protein HWV23_05610 [Natronomonas halophila]|uniref:hypothetical protein n=1 Tax=Natronomonas halophila TaxID=2747817 RepID=UPI0015B7878B|nr:hypothetical protein [Natronomonas halophila]QLD85221.1 hypothetical protein HWV23_05610 [Natronomonas halophila]